jgi:hypothetical protein
MIHYNPTTGRFINPGEQQFKFGRILDSETLLNLGYYEYYDPFKNREYENFLSKGGIRIQGNLAIQEYEVSSELLNSLASIKYILNKDFIEAVDDDAAGEAGVQYGEFYHSGGIVKIRQNPDTN